MPEMRAVMVTAPGRVEVVETERLLTAHIGHGTDQIEAG